MARSKPVDLQAFRNLVDPKEEAYLRSSLRPREFRRLQRKRMLVATEYTRRTAHNAALLLQVANAVRRASDPQLSKAGAALADSALQLRIYSILAICLFGLSVIFPSVPIRGSEIAFRYEGLRERMAGLTRIQRPASVSEVEAAL